MKYIRLHNDRVIEIIPEYSDIFPDIPVDERYSEEFLSECVAVDDSVEAYVGWIYGNSAFTAPVESFEPEQPVEHGTPTVTPDGTNSIIQEIADILEGRV